MIILPGNNTVYQAAGGALSCPSQHKGFIANGLYWQFFALNNNIYYKVSVDNISWSSANVLRGLAGVDDSYFAVTFDGTYAHYALHNNSDTFYYRRFTPNANGTVTFSAAEQMAWSGINPRGNISIAVDSSGYPFMSAKVNAYPIVDEQYCVEKCSTNDGTWATATTPFATLTQLKKCYAGGCIIPITAGKMYIFYDDYQPNSRLYSGSAWGDAENPDFGQLNNTNQNITLLADTSNNVYAIESLAGTSNYEIAFAKRTYGGTWGTKVQLDGSTPQHNVTAIYDSTSNSILILAVNIPNSGDIGYKIYDCATGAWNSASWTTLINDATGITGWINAFYQTSSSKIGIQYQQTTSGDLHFVDGTNAVIYPSFPLTRVTSLVHRWAAGKQGQPGVYKLEIGLGGLSSTYITPVDDIQPTPSIYGQYSPGTQQYRPHELTPKDCIQWLGAHSKAEILSIFGHPPSFQEWTNWMSSQK